MKVGYLPVALGELVDANDGSGRLVEDLRLVDELVGRGGAVLVLRVLVHPLREVALARVVRDHAEGLAVEVFRFNRWHVAAVT